MITVKRFKNKLILALILCAPLHSYSANPNDPNDAFASPDLMFDASTRLRNTVQVTWKVVDDPQAVCEKYAETKFGYRIDSCAVRNEEDTKCTIVTGKRTTMGDLGHELRHCFQGSWHTKDLGKDSRSTSR